MPPSRRVTVVALTFSFAVTTAGILAVTPTPPDAGTLGVDPRHLYAGIVSPTRLDGGSLAVTRAPFADAHAAPHPEARGPSTANVHVDPPPGATAANPLPQIPDAFFQSLRWRSIGPSRGGRAVAAAGDPRHRLVAYAGTTGGGVWKTDDGGISWRNVTDGFVKTGSVGALATAPSNPDIVYVGMGESCFRGDASHGDGVYRSSDAGTTWIHTGLAETRHIARIAVDPRDPETVFVAAFGDGFGPSDARGVYRSRDGGRTWTKVLFRGPDVGAADLAIDATDPRIVYATLIEFRRFPWGLRSAGPGTALYKSTDGGETWTDLSARPGLPQGPKGRIGIALSAARPTRVWALIDAGLRDRGLYRSDDAGATWARVSDDARLTCRAWYYNHVFADPRDPETVYVLTEEFYRSTDGGRSVTRLITPHDDHHDLWIDPSDPQHLVQASDAGGHVSFDGGGSWTSALNQVTAQFYHVTTDNGFPYRVYGAQQDNGSISVPSRSDFGAISEIDWRQEAAGETGYIAVHPTEPDVVFGGDHHWLYRMDHRSRQLRDISPWPETHYGWGTADMKYRFQWTYPVVLSPHDPETLYATAQVVFRSRNRGDSWDVISPDLTRADPKTLERTPRHGREEAGAYWGPVTRDSTGAEWYATIFAFAESPVAPGVLWAGSDDGYIHLSRDAGKTWQNVTPPELPEFSLVSIIDASPHDAGTAYVAATRYKLQDRQPYLFSTRDFGRTWTRITHGIPGGDFTRVIREDPVRRGLLYAGTETGVHVSFDDGRQWQPLQLNLPVVPIHDLVVTGGDLVVATHGRSFWILDEVELLRQFDREVLASETYLFAPRRTIRFRGDADTPLRGAAQGTATVGGENPPSGAVIHYYLARAPEAGVTITISDAHGAIVRRFSSNEGPERLRPSSRPGSNRFVWDLRYPDPVILPGTVLHRRPVGPVAAPGSFTVTLESAGQTLSRPLIVSKDPRLTVTDQDLLHQFTLLTEIGRTLTETHALVGRIREVRRRAWNAVDRAGGERAAGWRGAAMRLDARLYPIEEVLTQYRARAQKDLTSNPSGIDNKLAVLASFVAQADAAPTRASRALLGELQERVREQAAAFDEVLKAKWSPLEISEDR